MIKSGRRIQRRLCATGWFLQTALLQGLRSLLNPQRATTLSKEFSKWLSKDGLADAARMPGAGLLDGYLIEGRIAP